MKIGIMQPYFFPYIGYFQLIKAVDVFVVYDNIKYTKKGWINRNRMLQNGKDVMFSLPLKSGSDFLDVRERELATEFNRDKLLNQFKDAYHRAPYFEQTFPLVEQIVRNEELNLFRFLHYSLAKTCEHLGITTEIRASSDIGIDHDLKSQDKVLALCAAVGANTYLNPIGGVELYDKGRFMGEGIDLHFLKTDEFSYSQFGNGFIPWLSILDVMMFNSKEAITKMLTQCSLR
ncbi:MAG: WbqC family protein [Deltaproteobacteria bacterium]|nr:WbqC family protein [Deltaproteobacteria bacterium]